MMKRTYVYVDGFNLYYRALRNTRHIWLNIELLVQGLLDPDNVIEKIRYFTAPVSGKLDPGQLSGNSDISTHCGHFLLSQSTKATFLQRAS